MTYTPTRRNRESLVKTRLRGLSGLGGLVENLQRLGWKVAVLDVMDPVFRQSFAQDRHVSFHGVAGKVVEVAAQAQSHVERDGVISDAFHERLLPHFIRLLSPPLAVAPANARTFETRSTDWEGCNFPSNRDDISVARIVALASR